MRSCPSDSSSSSRSASGRPRAHQADRHEAELADVAEQRAADLAAVAEVEPEPPAYLASPVAEDDQAPTRR